MTEQKHTPGPWHRNIPPAGKYPVVWSGRNTHVALLALGPRHGADLQDEELEANLNIIAAAPEMLAALKQLLSISEDKGVEGDNTTLPAARAAVAKAEGRS